MRIFTAVTNLASKDDITTAIDYVIANEKGRVRNKKKQII